MRNMFAYMNQRIPKLTKKEVEEMKMLLRRTFGL